MSRNKERMGSGQEVTDYINKKMGHLDEGQLAALHYASQNKEEEVLEEDVARMNEVPTFSATKESSSDDFNIVLSTEFAELPTRGEFYEEGHPLRKEIGTDIREPTARDENILANSAYIKRNTVLDEFLKSILVNKSINPDDLVSVDKKALLVAARFLGYGSLYATRISCPNCGESTDYEFDLAEYLHRSYSFMDNLDEVLREFEVTRYNHDSFEFKLPRSGLVVRVAALYGRDERRLLRASKSRKKSKFQQEATMTDLYRLYVRAFNGKESPAIVNKVLLDLPAQDTMYMRTVYNAIFPDIEMKSEYECPECMFLGEVEVPMNPDFFWVKPKTTGA